MRAFYPVLATAMCLATGAFAQTAPPNVGPAGPPNGIGVSVLNTPLPVTGTVTTTINNPPSNPIPVIANTVSTDEPGRHPYQVSYSKGCGGGLGCNIDSPALPTGFRLVTQQVSCSTSYTGGTPTSVSVRVATNGSANPASTSFFSPFADGRILFTQRLDMYQDANGLANTIDVGIGINSPGDTAKIGTTFCTLTGYLINCANNSCAAIVNQ